MAQRQTHNSHRHLLGTITSLSSTTSGSSIGIELNERTVKREDAEDVECSSSTSTSNTQKTRQRVHRIKLIGAWSRSFLPDLKACSTLKINLQAYEPHFDRTNDRWEFRNGIHAELLFDNPFDDQLPFALKTVDIVPRLSGDLSEPSTIVEPESATQPSTSSTSHCQLNLQANQRGHKETNGLARSTTKRPLAAESHSAENYARDHPDQSLPPINQPDSLSNSQNPHKRPYIHSTQSHPNSDHHSDPLQTSIHSTSSYSSTRSNANDPPIPASKNTTSLIKPARPAPSQLPSYLPSNPSTGALPLKTLHQIEQLHGGTKQSFNLIALIDEKKTEECERASRGSSDYKMTIYLSDSSRMVGSRNVTCNLFWKNSQDCPPWNKALWKVIFLFNVYKRYSEIYDTQIIGPSNAFQWALWCPGYTGSAEQFLSSTKNINQFSSLFGSSPADLKAEALALYQHYTGQSPLDPSSQPPAATIPKTISQLANGQRQKFDLCVEIIDLWVDGVGSDRMTVTDYTPNLTLRNQNLLTCMDGLSSSSPILDMHRSNGGGEDNCKLTESRILTVYIEQPILQACYGQFVRQTDQLFSGTPSAHDYRFKFVNNCFRLCQLDLRVRAGSTNSGTVYAVMVNPFKPRVSRPDETLEIEPDSRALLADRILPLSPSDLAYQKLLDDKEMYQRQLQESV